MRKLIVALLFFCTHYTGHGQNTETDSLKKLLAVTKEGPERVMLLEGLSFAYLSAYPDTALQYALEGLQLAQKIKDEKGEAYCTNALGNVYHGIGDYPTALDFYLKSLKMKERLNNESALAVTYFNISNVYVEQEDYHHALTYLFRTKQIDEKLKDSTGILFDYYSLGSIYLRMEKIDSALFHIRQAYSIAQRTQDKNMIGAIRNTFAEVYASLNNLPVAVRYYHQSIADVQLINDNEVLGNNFHGLATVYRKMKLLDSALYYGHRSLNVARKAPFLKQVLSSSKLLAELYKEKGQYDSAFTYQELNIATKDSLFNLEKVRKVQNLKFQELQRQHAIETAKKEYLNQLKLYVLLIGLIIFLLIAVFLWRNNVQKQKAFALLQQQKDETDRQKGKVEQTLDELKNTQAQLVQREKMASLGELTAGIAHEIQNPLNFINNFSEINKELIAELKKEVRSQNPDEALNIANEIDENEQKINHHGKRADSIVKAMLQHSRISTGQKEPTDINALADEYLRLSYHGIRGREKGFNAALQINFDSSIGKINIVTQDIGRVLLNLYNNSFYALQQKKRQSGGTYEPTLQVHTQKKEGMAEIRIKDNGTGIPQKVIDKIYQPFFTTKPTGEGTGLGLSLSYDIITKGHGGELKVNTKEGEFAEFVIRLPA